MNACKNIFKYIICSYDTNDEDYIKKPKRFVYDH